MSSSRTFAALFSSNRAPYGCARGDDALWNRMRDLSINEPWPSTVSEIRPRVLRYFEEIVGQAPTGDDEIIAPQLGTYGISGGVVKPTYWEEIAIPYLEQSYREVSGDEP